MPIIGRGTAVSEIREGGTGVRAIQVWHNGFLLFDGTVAGVAIGSSAAVVLAGYAGVAGGGARVSGTGGVLTLVGGDGAVVAGAVVAGAAGAVGVTGGTGEVRYGATITGSSDSIVIAGGEGVAAEAEPGQASGTASTITVGGGDGTAAGGATVTGAASPVTATGGAGTVTGGATVTGTAGAVTVTSGAGQVAAGVTVTGTGGQATVTSGAGTAGGGASVTGTRGQVTVTGGSGTATSRHVAVAGRQTGSITGTTSHSISALPISGGAAGDLLLVAFAGSGAASTSSAGWTKIGQPDPGSTPSVTVFAGIVGTAGALTVTTSTSTRSAYAGIRVTGWSGNLSDIKLAGATGYSSTPNPPNLTPGLGGTYEMLWWAIAAMNAGRIPASAPANYGNLQTQGTGGIYSGDVGLAAAERILTAAAEDPGAFGAAAFADNWDALTAAVY